MADIKDDFWDIEKLVPKKEKPKYVQTRHDTSAVEISIDAEPQKSDALVCRAIPQRVQAQSGNIAPELEYSPESPLISKVRIFKTATGYRYYEQFCEDAERIARATPRPSDCVPYFSYVPQFCQLSRAQLDFYVYWRSLVFSGEYTKTEYSYILLLIFEIINRGGRADTSEGQRVLCGLWLNYRDEFPRLDRYLCEWICDYSLIHRLPPPLGFAEQGIAEYSTLKEFYVYYDSSDSLGYSRALMHFCSAYDHKKSKFYKGDAQKIFDDHITGALAYVLRECSAPGKLLSEAGLEDNLITREAYSGALCSSFAKRRIEVSYFSFSRSHELRFLIADIIKYSENKIRAYLGIKSRLGVFSVPDAVSRCLDEYFVSFLPSARRTPKRESESAEYEKLYDAPKTELSVNNAEKIEDSSWRVTQMLVDAFDGIDEKKNEIQPIAQKEEPKEGPPNEQSIADALRAALGEKYEFVTAALSEDAERQREISDRLGILAEALADEINDAAAEITGDIILEDVGDFYTIIEDYREIFLI